MQLHADWAITMHCQDTCPYVPGIVEDWDVDDPAGQTARGGARDPRRDREPRQELLDERADEIRADRTAHARRLARLLPSLAEEFDATRRPRRSARAPTRSSTATTTRRYGRSSSRSRCARPATACARRPAPLARLAEAPGDVVLRPLVGRAR